MYCVYIDEDPIAVFEFCFVGNAHACCAAINALFPGLDVWVGFEAGVIA